MRETTASRRARESRTGGSRRCGDHSRVSATRYTRRAGRRAQEENAAMLALRRSHPIEGAQSSTVEARGCTDRARARFICIFGARAPRPARRRRRRRALLFALLMFLLAPTRPLPRHLLVFFTERSFSPALVPRSRRCWCPVFLVAGADVGAFSSCISSRWRGCDHDIFLCLRLLLSIARRDAVVSRTGPSCCLITSPPVLSAHSDRTSSSSPSRHWCSDDKLRLRQSR